MAMPHHRARRLPASHSRSRAGTDVAAGAGIALAALLLAAAPVPASEAELTRLLTSEKPEEQTRWAVRFEHGEGIDRDYAAAVRLYCHAANAGYTDAHYRLGWMYANGRGVPRDDALAAAWLQIAAGQGDAHAQRMLRRLGEPAAATQCRMPDGSTYELPLRSVPNPAPALIARWVDLLAPRYELDPNLVLAVIRAESNFNPTARSPKNAQGLMQLIPDTARRFGVEDVWDPLENLRGGMAYLQWLLEHFEGDETLALAGYNAGENAVHRHKGVPPYPETRAYVKKIARWRLARPELPRDPV